MAGSIGPLPLAKQSLLPPSFPSLPISPSLLPYVSNPPLPFPLDAGTCIYIDVAEWLMNRCINHRELGVDERGILSSAEAAQDFVVEYNFQFLEDFNDACSRFPGMKFFRRDK